MQHDQSNVELKLDTGLKESTNSMIRNYRTNSVNINETLQM